MKITVEGKIAVVTGATKGIGRAIAEALAENGADVVVTSRNAEECRAAAEALRARYGCRALGVAADVTRQEDIERLVSGTAETFGRLDIWVNNAGTAITRKAEDLTREDWDSVVDLGLKAVFFCSQAAGRRMMEQKTGGAIINVSSIFGLVGERQVVPYCAAKGGVLQMTRALALEWAKYGIRVNAICPGYVLTGLIIEYLSHLNDAAKPLRKIAVRRFAQPEEITGAVVFLASDASGYMTGQTVTVDGGLRRGVTDRKVERGGCKGMLQPPLLFISLVRVIPRPGARRSPPRRYAP